MNTYQELKEIAWQCNMELPKLGLVVHAFGNASVIDRARGLVAIKPSGVRYDKLRPEDMVVVSLDNKVVDGALHPSSDTRTHTVLYRHFSHIAGVVHTHSTFAVAWAQAGRPIPILGTTHADHLPWDIPCTPPMTERMIKGDYEEETGKLIVKTVARRSPVDVPMVLVGGHGSFAWGATPEEAVEHSLMLEQLAKLAYVTLQINPRAPRLKKALIAKHYHRKHGPASYYGQTNSGPGKGDHQ